MVKEKEEEGASKQTDRQGGQLPTHEGASHSVRSSANACSDDDDDDGGGGGGSDGGSGDGGDMRSPDCSSCCFYHPHRHKHTQSSIKSMAIPVLLL